MRTLRHGYYAAISYVDAQIGKVIAELDRLGLTGKTIIVLWSDHGYHLGEHGLWAKTSNFELDARVPLIISSPFYKAGQRTRAIVELLDLYPTLTELCDLKPPSHLEGVSLVPLLHNPEGTVKPCALTQTPRPNYPRRSKPQIMGYSIRTERFRYTEWQHYKTGEVSARELYDHKNDPAETRNVAGQQAYNKQIRQHSALLKQTLK